MSTPRLAVIGIVVADMAASLAFYRRLGLDVPAEADNEPHVAFELPGGLQLTWDTIDTIHSFDPGGPPRSAAPARRWRSTAARRTRSTEVYAELVAAGATAHLEPWDAFGGCATPRCTTPTATASTSSPPSAERSGESDARETVHLTRENGRGGEIA